MSSHLSRHHCRRFKTSLFLLLTCAVMTTAPAQVTSTPNTLYRIAGDGKNSGKQDGVGPEARFSEQLGIVKANDGLWVVDRYNHSLRRIAPDGRVATVIGQQSKCGDNDGASAVARLCSPTAIATDDQGSLYIADSLSSSIRRFRGGFLVTLAKGSTLCRGNGANDLGPLCFPTALAFHKGQLYVVDARGLIYQIDVLTGGVKVLAGQDEMKNRNLSSDPRDKCSSADGVGVSARFCEPRGIAVHPATGNLYVADTGSNAIRKVTPDGVVTTLAKGNCSSSDKDFCAPLGIAIDTAGNLYVADILFARIRKITPGGLVSTVAGTSNSRATVPGPLPGAIARPTGLALIGENQLAITTSNAEVLGINF